jgi:hypothetical protein
MTNQEAYRLVGVLFASYPLAKFTNQNADAYAGSLADLPLDKATQAIERLRRTSKFLPTVSEIRECCSDLSVGSRRTGSEAWDTLQKAARRWGWQRPPKITDTKMEHAIGVLGGWVAVCSITIDAEMSARARFIEAYDMMSKRERLDLDSGIPLPAQQIDGGISQPRTLKR